MNSISNFICDLKHIVQGVRSMRAASECLEATDRAARSTLGELRKAEDEVKFLRQQNQNLTRAVEECPYPQAVQEIKTRLFEIEFKEKEKYTVYGIGIENQNGIPKAVTERVFGDAPFMSRTEEESVKSGKCPRCKAGLRLLGEDRGMRFHQCPVCHIFWATPP